MVERRNKWTFSYIFVLFAVLICSVFYSPQKAQSISLSQNVSYLGRWGIYYNSVQGQGTCQYTNTGTGGYAYATTSTCAPDFYIFNLNGKAWNKDYIVEIPLYVYDLKNDSLLSSYQNSSPILQVNSPNGSFTAEYIGSYFNLDSTSSVIGNMYFRLNNGISGTQYFNTSSGMSLYPRVGMNQGEYMSIGGDWGVLAFADMGNFSSAEIVNAINQARIENGNWQAQINQNIQELRQAIIDNRTSINNIDNSVQNIENNFEQQQQDQQQQGSDSQDNSNQAGQDVEQSTTNLLSFITGFFGAFTSATATSCVTDWGIEGFRHFDFCATEIPVQLRVVFTIVSAVVFIPMVWFLINSILKAFKEFQEG